MEAKLVAELPEELGWQFEPKWDGFRSSRSARAIRSISGRNRASRWGAIFPKSWPCWRASSRAGSSSTASWQSRSATRSPSMRYRCASIPAESRIKKLAGRDAGDPHPVRHAARHGGNSLIEDPLVKRRAALERFYKAAGQAEGMKLSPCTADRKQAERWLDSARGALDGVVAKRSDGAYLPGERAMLKVKRLRTADCVVGGFRYESGSREVGSLLLGLYNDDGKLDHVGFTATITRRRAPGAHQTARSADRATGLHRQGAGGPEPLEHRAQRRMGAGETEACRRGALRPCHRRPLPSRHQARPLPARQGAEAMHLRADRATNLAQKRQAFAWLRARSRQASAGLRA